MSIRAYLDSVKSRLLTDSKIDSFHLIRERETLTDGHLRVRLKFVDGSFLEFSEYVQISSDNSINLITYSYHWNDAEGNLIRRWDNAPHFPEFPGFPHHVHEGVDNIVHPGVAVTISLILDEIVRAL